VVVDLKKYIDPDSLRGKGLWPSGFDPGQVPIAGKSRDAILSALGCEGFEIGGVSSDNAFVVRSGNSIIYLYARPQYSNYRRVATLRFGSIPPKHDVDHVHARNLAIHYGYLYVLVALLPQRPNRQHGLYERNLKVIESGDDVPEVCFPDDRILDKILRRNSKVRRGIRSEEYKYDPKNRTELGLALNQRGLWNMALGFDRPAPEKFVASLRPLSNF
jgi:hypothetical protein